jgi:hypothetical protein
MTHTQERLKRVEEQQQDAQAVLAADPFNASAQVCFYYYSYYY